MTPDPTTRQTTPTNPTWRRAASGIAVLSVLLTACGVPTGPDSFEDLGDEVPDRIAETSTTSTTSTTTTTTTTVPDPTESTALATTTTMPVEFVDVYFLSRGELVAVEEAAPSPAIPNDLIDLLELGPTSPLRDNLIAEGLILSADFAGGEVTIDLDDRIYRSLGRDRTTAIAQMVFTFITNLDTVGKALFTFDGESQDFPKGDGLSTDEPVSVDDYRSLLAEDGSTLTPPDVPDTSTTTAPATTVPETSTPETTTTEATENDAEAEPATTDATVTATTGTGPPTTAAADQ